MLNPAIAKLTIPPRMANLPLDHRGYPVPKFVAWIDGKADFRCVQPGFVGHCIRLKRCWLCEQPLGRNMAFVIGPMCAINRTSAEPPSHLDCAHFAVQACPFMTHPHRKRNSEGLPEDHDKPAGFMIERNPGVCLIWVTREYHTFSTRAEGAEPGLLLKLGDPVATEWWAEGRKATREEIMHSINTGLPALLNMAKLDGPDAIKALEKEVAKGLALVPTA